MASYPKESILNREEVMDTLKISRSTYYKLVRTGKLSSFKEGSRYKVPVSAVDNYIQESLSRKEGK